MSSSAPRLQLEAEAKEPSPFCYAEAQLGAASGLTAEQAAEERGRRAQAEAFERGREAGQQQLRASVDAALQRTRDQILDSLQAFAKERASYYLRVEGEVVQLGLAIARKILHREAQIDPRLLAGIVRVTLEKLDATTKVELHVPPQETTEWRHFFACQPDGTIVPQVLDDAALSPGECRVVTSLGTTDVGLDAQLKEIETGLMDLLAERPCDGRAKATPAEGALKR